MTRTCLLAVSLLWSSLAFAGLPREKLALSRGDGAALGTTGTAKVTPAPATSPDAERAQKDAPKESKEQAPGRSRGK